MIRRPTSTPNLRTRSGCPLRDHFSHFTLLGKGTTGTVFRANARITGLPVVIKMLNPEFLGTDEASGRFLLEVRAMAAVESDHVVAIKPEWCRVDRGVSGRTVRRLAGG
jgi:hypothetical protein